VELPDLPDPLPVPVVDSHCHLDSTQAKSGLEPEEAIRLAKQVGVTKIVQIGCDPEGCRWAVEAAERWPSVIAGVAIHPNDAARMGADLMPGLELVETLAQQPRVRAVGETGLDYYRTRDAAGQAVQQEAFAAHIAFAKRYDKTLVIHDRDAHDDILTVLDSAGPPARIVMHCFSGDDQFARACLDRGAYLSFAGTITFKNNDHLRDALAVTPLDRILVETDAPYLAPVPYRGKRNEPAFVAATVAAVAALKGIDPKVLAAATTDNFFRLFQKAARPAGV
jgi:TatD DNase family protein